MPRPKAGDGFSIVLVTCPVEASEKIARAALDGRAAACVNTLPGVRSLYWWKGKVEDASECLLLFKTRAALLDELERIVKEVHPYEVPEMIALPITRGSRPYLDWIAESTRAMESEAPTRAARRLRGRGR
jgi:periplasmic divalent cation tolerance protein